MKTPSKSTNKSKLAKKMKIWKEALTYCADHARPSIVQDVAREALKYRG